VTLSWTSVGATSASIADIGSVATSGDLLIEELNEDTTYTMTVLGDYIGDTEEREQATCSILIGTHSGGGGGGGDRLVRDPEGEVLGDSDSANSNESDPQPLVLGEQVSAVPVGGVNTGGGGTASNHNTYGVAAITIISTLMAAFVAFRLRQLHA
jgi:hypothetical protein